MSIRFSPLLDFVLKAFSEVDIQFVLFEFIVGLYGNPTTLIKCTDLVLTNKQEMFLKAKIIKTDLPNVHKMGVSIFKINLKKKKSSQI